MPDNDTPPRWLRDNQNRIWQRTHTGRYCHLDHDGHRHIAARDYIDHTAGPTEPVTIVSTKLLHDLHTRAAPAHWARDNALAQAEAADARAERAERTTETLRLALAALLITDMEEPR